MPYSDPGKNLMLDALGVAADFMSLHSAYPGGAGANEIAGGAPAYTREAIAWGAAAAGVLPSASSPTFDVPGATTVSWLGFWSLAVGGVFYGSAPLSAGTPAPFEADDATDFLTADNHGLTNGLMVVVYDTTGAVLPAPLVEGTIYFVVGATTDTFQLSLTSGGAAINLTADGAGFVQTILPETFGAQGQLVATSTQLDLLR